MYRRRIAMPVTEPAHSRPLQAVSLVLALVLVAIGVYPEPLVNLVQVAAESLPGGITP
jgi:NADH:ubiquinone oxidoreductase subunit 2 (subunit N)